MRRLRSLFRRAEDERRLDSELERHLSDLIRDYVESGMTDEEARRTARLVFGNAASIKEDVREAWGWMWIDRAIQDLRYASRVWRQAPAFTLAAVLTLGIGIGATVAIFTQVKAVFWDSLPVRSPEEIRTLRWDSPTLGNSAGRFSYAAYRSLRDKTHLSDLSCTWAIRNAMAEWGPVRFQLVTGNYFSMLGVSAILGRTIAADDDNPGNPSRVAAISYHLWQRAYGGATSIVGRTITINQIPFQIIGALPEGFAGLDPSSPREVMLPYSTRALLGGLPQRDETSWNACMEVAGRLGPGISEAQAQAEAQAVLDDAIRVNPPKNSKDARVILTPASDSFGPRELRRRTSQALILLIATAGLILLIACANIASLLLARGRARQKELATRLAVGAARSRIVRQLLTESFLLCLLGGGLGIVLAYAIAPVAPDLLSEVSGLRQQWMSPSLTVGVDLRPDAGVIGFALALTVLTGLLFGVAPALRSTRMDLVSMMKLAAGGRFRFKAGATLVGVQTALSTMLLIGAGLFLRTFVNLVQGPVGYTPEGLIFVTVDPSRSPESFISETSRRLEAMPGVASVAVSQWPLYNSGGAFDKHPVCAPSGSGVENPIDVEPVTGRYFETWGVRLIAGREFQGADAGKAVIVNETFANRFFPHQNPIGQEIGVFKCPGAARTIVGLVADHRDRQRAALTPMVYVPYPSRPTTPTTLAARTTGDATPLLPVVRRFMADAGANVDGDVMTGFAYKQREWKKERLLAGFFVFFAAMALLISCLGIYGLLAYTVHWRTAEIGIRMALGAGRTAVVRMVVRESLSPACIGMGAGILAALALTRFIESILFGISDHDPWVIAAAALILLFSAVLASLAPARRAAGVEPMRALRYE